MVVNVMGYWNCFMLLVSGLFSKFGDRVGSWRYLGVMEWVPNDWRNVEKFTHIPFWLSNCFELFHYLFKLLPLFFIVQGMLNIYFVSFFVYWLVCTVYDAANKFVLSMPFDIFDSIQINSEPVMSVPSSLCTSACSFSSIKEPVWTKFGGMMFTMTLNSTVLVFLRTYRRSLVTGITGSVFPGSQIRFLPSPFYFLTTKSSVLFSVLCLIRNSIQHWLQAHFGVTWPKWYPLFFPNSLLCLHQEMFRGFFV